MTVETETEAEDFGEVAEGCELVAGSCRQMADVLREMAGVTRALGEQMQRSADPRQARGPSAVPYMVDERRVFGDAFRWGPQDGEPWIP